jgi:hypothetical protein
MKKKYIKVIHDEYRKKDRLLTLDEVVNGYDTLDGWPRDTSMGYTYKMKGITKFDMFGKDGDRLMDTEKFLEYKERYEHMLETMKKGIVIPTVHNQFLKDECLSIQKVLDGKVRLIEGVDFDKYGSQKTLRGFAHNIVNKHPVVLGGCIGMNPYGNDCKIFQQAIKGWKLFDGDVKSWDTIFYPFLRKASDEIYEVLYPHATDEERMARACDSFDSANAICAVHLEDGTFFIRMQWGTRSGGVDTLYSNTFGNGTLARYGYLCGWCESQGIDPECYNTVEYDEIDIDYHMTKMDSMELGDDILMLIAPDVDYYDFFAAQRQMARLDIGYVDGSKTGIEKPFKEITEVTLCKRKLVWCDVLQEYVWALEIGSILNALYWSEANESDFCQVIDQMVGEISFHGREEWPLAQKIISLANFHYGHVVAHNTLEKAVLYLSKREGPLKW